MICSVLDDEPSLNAVMAIMKGKRKEQQDMQSSGVQLLEGKRQFKKKRMFDFEDSSPEMKRSSKPLN